jgi:hypothetical protein
MKKEAKNWILCGFHRREDYKTHKSSLNLWYNNLILPQNMPSKHFKLITVNKKSVTTYMQ